MELNREQIIKALECCIKAESRGDCEELGCPAHTKQGCYFYLRTDDDYENIIYIELCKDALSLIKELTEENAEVKANWQKLKESHESDCEECRAEFKRLTEENERLRAELAERPPKLIITKLPKKDQIAKEMLEEKT